MRDLLIRLDQRVADGFETISRDFSQVRDDVDRVKVRVSDIERELGDRPLLKEQFKEVVSRVDDLEEWKSEARGALKLGGFLKVAIGIAIAALAYLGWRVELAPTQAPPSPIVQAVAK